LKLKNLVTALRMQNPLSLYRIMGDRQSVVRMYFLHAAIESGLLEALDEQPTREKLVAALDAARPEILDALLEIGISLKEIACDAGRYRVVGKRTRALRGEGGDALRAMVQANASYYNDAYRNAAARLRGAPRGDDLAEIGDLVARASALAEPFIRDFVEDLVSGTDPMRILEIGCGSGVFMRCAADANPRAGGVGIDMDPLVAARAGHNLSEWGIGDRFRAVTADVRALPPEIGGPFDLITLYNVIYYFSVEQREGLLRTLRSLLAPDGRLAIVSSIRSAGGDLGSAHLNLVTASLEGCTPLPEVDELTGQLRDCGFAKPAIHKLVPGGGLLGFSARPADPESVTRQSDLEHLGR
jgi:SAM-dependent methyltransferase